MNCDCDKRTIRSEEEKKQLISRINRIIGQTNAIKTMIENDRYCPEILIQLKAIEKAIKSLSSVVLDRHLHTCLIKGIKNNDYSAIDEIIDLFRRF